jgi:hypothetical protein
LPHAVFPTIRDYRVSGEDWNQPRCDKSESILPDARRDRYGGSRMEPPEEDKKTPGNGFAT